MKISLATNFDDSLIDSITEYPVYEVYGKFKEDMVGGGRPASSFDLITKEKLEKHVKKTISAGIKFNYLLNGSCLSNLECSKDWQLKFRNFLDYLSEIGVNALTISNPLILKIIKKYYTNFSVRVSIFACVDSLEKALYWDDMGADYICADVLNVNRDFKKLDQMVSNLPHAKIELLANVSCLKSCPMIHTHSNWNAHASNGNKNLENDIDYCILYCQEKELRDASLYLKSCWIRPEDVHYYEEIGVEHFKLTERNIPTIELLKRVKAYSERHYDGNLLDLVQGHGFYSNSLHSKLELSSKTIDCNKLVKQIAKIRGMGCERFLPSHVYIDNKKLEGFIDFFRKGKCTGVCSKCNYCKRIANKAINENLEIKQMLLELYNQFNNNFI